MLPHRPRVADRSAGVVFSPLRAVGRDTLPTGVGGLLRNCTAQQDSGNEIDNAP